jgi:hypothetical protein
LSQSAAPFGIAGTSAFAIFLPVAWLLHCGGSRRTGERIMDPKLAMLFMLFGSIIGLSYLNADNVARMKRRMIERRWRKSVPAVDKI